MNTAERYLEMKTIMKDLENAIAERNFKGQTLAVADLLTHGRKLLEEIYDDKVSTPKFIPNYPRALFPGQY